MASLYTGGEAAFGRGQVWRLSQTGFLRSDVKCTHSAGIPRPCIVAVCAAISVHHSYFYTVMFGDC